MHYKTRHVSGKVQTPIMPAANEDKNTRADLARWPTGFTIDVRPSDLACFLNPLPTDPKPWLKVFLYVAGESTRAPKLLMLDRITSLGSLSSQFCSIPLPTQRSVWSCERTLSAFTSYITASAVVVMCLRSMPVMTKAGSLLSIHCTITEESVVLFWRLCGGALLDDLQRPTKLLSKVSWDRQ
jgi:hypothetical protein